MEWLRSAYVWVSEPMNWPILTAGCYVADKVVKATPWKADDFVVDIVVGGIKKLFGKSPVDESQP